MNPPLRIDYVSIHGLWMPCEYERCQDKVIIRCLGDVDRACLELPCQPMLFDEAVGQYFAAVPSARKMVVLVPRVDIALDRWACRQVLKHDLVAEIQESLAGAEV